VATVNCLIVRAFGRQLDLLRSEASRIAKGGKIDWWVDRTDTGVCFCFENLEAKAAFASICQNFGVQHLEGQSETRDRRSPALSSSL
jgi:hypothetical protein